jgi:ribosomal protein S18 acetylase RimI-like enzyme
MAKPSPYIRPAARTDVPAIVALLADDPIGQSRETMANLAPYLSAFDALAGESGTHLLVAEDDAGAVIGCVQVTITRHLSYGGARRALLEDLRVASSCRNQGVGQLLVLSAIELARSAECRVVQLFVHQSRDHARRFYRGLGFDAAHDGLRLTLD